MAISVRTCFVRALCDDRWPRLPTPAMASVGLSSLIGLPRRVGDGSRRVKLVPVPCDVGNGASSRALHHRCPAVAAGCGRGRRKAGLSGA